MAEKQRFAIEDLATLGDDVEVQEGKFLPLRALNIEEMISLFITDQVGLLNLYAAAMDQGKKTDAETYSAFLIGAPELVAKVIAISSDSSLDPETLTNIRKRMPGTVQLIALVKIMKLSVPDPKKVAELLSGAMAQLRRIKQETDKLEQAALPSGPVS